MRAVQMVADHIASYRSLTAAVVDIARKLGCSVDSLRVWYNQSQRDAGRVPPAVDETPCWSLRGERRVVKLDTSRNPSL